VDRCELALTADGPQAPIVLALGLVVDAEHGGAGTRQAPGQEPEPAGDGVVVVRLEAFGGERLADRVDDDHICADGLEVCHRVARYATLAVDEWPIGADVGEPLTDGVRRHAERQEARYG